MRFSESTAQRATNSTTSCTATRTGACSLRLAMNAGLETTPTQLWDQPGIVGTTSVEALAAGCSRQPNAIPTCTTTVASIRWKVEVSRKMLLLSVQSTI